MREILFRGKRVDNGEWVESGSLLQFLMIGGCKKMSIAPRGTKPHIKKDGQVIQAEEIFPETVGQYTGLTDKNGTRIFEGDVVKLFDIAIGEIVCEYGAFGISCRQQIDYDYLASEIASITVCDNTPMFCRNDNFVSLWELYSNYNEENSEISVIEVIGNIYDNPELLKGE